MSRAPVPHPLRFLAPVLLILAGAGCAKHEAAEAPAPYVSTTVATFGSIEPSQTLAGIIAPYENVAIQSTLSEPADAVYVQEGDYVHAGQLLARLDTADLQAQLQADLATANSNQATTAHTVYQGSLTIQQGVDAVRSGQAALQQAQSTLNNDQTNLQRDRNLLASGYVSQQAVDQQETTVRNDQQALQSAQAALDAAKANVAANGTLGGQGLQASAVQQSQAQVAVAVAQANQVRVQIAKAAIYSPIDGVVVNRNLNPGEYPGNRQLFTLQQVSPIYAVLHASGGEVARIQNGAPAEVVVSQLGPDAKYAGRVIGVLNEINPGSTDFQVKVLLQNPQRRLRPGMAVSGSVAVPAIRGIRVPETAFTDDNHDAVMTIGPDLTIKTVKVSESGSDGTTSIITGIAAGTRVVTDGQTSVGDGEKVSLR